MFFENGAGRVLWIRLSLFLQHKPPQSVLVGLRGIAYAYAFMFGKGVLFSVVFHPDFILCQQAFAVKGFVNLHCLRGSAGTFGTFYTADKHTLGFALAARYKVEHIVYAVAKVYLAHAALVPHNLCAWGFSLVCVAGSVAAADIALRLGNLKSVYFSVNAAAYPFACKLLCGGVCTLTEKILF